MEMELFHHIKAMEELNKFMAHTVILELVVAFALVITLIM